MIKKYPFYTLMLLTYPLESSQAPCEISIETGWQEIEENQFYKHDNKWVLVCTVTFKKRTEEPIILNTLDITWNGPEIEKLDGELFKNNQNKIFVPVDEAWVSDGIWQKYKQTLHFTFAHNEHLGSFSRFYLVLTVPQALEPTLQQGSFTIVEGALPYQLQTKPSTHLSFTLNPKRALFLA